MQNQCECPRCGIVSKLRFRNFSDQAMSALTEWGEIESMEADSNLCDPCYGDLRETLIDRADELANHKIGQVKPAPKPKTKRKTKKTPAKRTKRVEKSL